MDHPLVGHSFLVSSFFLILFNGAMLGNVVQHVSGMLKFHALEIFEVF